MRSGFVLVLGRPNVGKSSMINLLTKKHLAIVSNIPQTTRSSTKLIYNDVDSQIIFVDTPGIHTSTTKLGAWLNTSAYRETKCSDVILFLTPSNQQISCEDEEIIKKIQKAKFKIGVVTKTDLAENKQQLKEKAEKLKKYGFDEVFFITTKVLNSADKLVELIKKFLPPHPVYYPVNEFSDKPAGFFVEELIWEQAIKVVHQEIPHSLLVKIKNYEHTSKGIVIHACIYVEKESQKGILIGSHAKKIQIISKASRLKIQSFFNEKTHLFIRVGVWKKWRQTPQVINT